MRDVPRFQFTARAETPAVPWSDKVVQAAQRPTGDRSDPVRVASSSSKRGEELLPEPARAKLRGLKEAADEHLVVVQRLSSDLRQARDSRSAILAEIEQNKTVHGRPPLNVDLVRRLHGLDEEIARLEARLAPREEKWRAESRLLQRLGEYLEDLPRGVALAECSPPPPSRSRKQQSFGLDEIRDRIGALRADLHEVASAPLHSSQVKEKAEAFVQSLASRFSPPVYWLFEANINSFEWSTLPRPGSSPGDPGDFDVAGFQAWLDPDRLLAAMEREIDAISDDDHALSVEQRREKEGALKSEMLALERLEEDLCIAEDAPRRPDLDPRAFLNLSDSAPAPREPL
jgi:hypothetical protein